MENRVYSGIFDWKDNTFYIFGKLYRVIRVKDFGVYNDSWPLYAVFLGSECIGTTTPTKNPTKNSILTPISEYTSSEVIRFLKEIGLTYYMKKK